MLLVWATHYSPDLLASLWENPERARRALFYIFRGVEGAVLFALLMSQWRPRAAEIAVLMWGYAEETQTAVCRISQGVGNSPSAPMYSGLCGTEAYWVGVLVAAAFAIYQLDRVQK